LKDGELLLENLYFSIDATMRVWISGYTIVLFSAKTYVDPVLPGHTMFGQAVSRVLGSKSQKFQKGDYVLGLVQWTHIQIVSDAKFHLVKRGGDLDDLTGFSLLGPLGISGLTAYIGFEAIGKPKEGETVVISAAAGAVGEIAVQLAKTFYKCRVIGIAGGKQKCDYVKKELGAIECIDYKSENLNQKLKELAPNGVNVYFDNVGGEMLDDMLMHITDHTRIILCGAIATYNSTNGIVYCKLEPYKVKNYPRLIIKRAVMQGFLYFDHPELFKPG
jgi:NADPH-dependent curcumin reductase CurA